MMHFERWSLLIIGEALHHGQTRYADFLNNLDIAPSTLTARLDGLISSGLMEMVESSEGSRNQRYVLTEKGRGLETVVAALDEWSERWALPVPAPADLTVVAEGGSMDDDVDREKIELSMLGAFTLSVAGAAIQGLSVGSQRLLVFLALHDRAMGRAAVAGTMWPEVSNANAGISLRSALSRLDPATREAILIASAGLSLADTVAVDYHEAQLLAHRLLEQDKPVAPADVSSAALATLSKELLPDWYDDWVVAEAEDWRQLRMNGLEALARLLIEDGRLGEAAGAARAAMKVEPLRESAHATLISVHLSEGNQSEALRVFERYRVLLLAALDLEPTPRLAELVSSIQKA
jgi:DNA-binding SARP family transcriptional activator/DNA-binding HxlR family transcriptional regulator